jgi:hypothetical protein
MAKALAGRVAVFVRCAEVTSRLRLALRKALGAEKVMFCSVFVVECSRIATKASRCCEPFDGRLRSRPCFGHLNSHRLGLNEKQIFYTLASLLQKGLL